MSAQDESLAHTYAEALLDLVFEEGVHAEVLAELREFGALLEREERFATFLNTPNIPQRAKKDVVRRVFSGAVSDHTLHFLLIVIDKRRQYYLPRMVEAFEEGYHERMGELVASVRTAVPLNDEQRERLTRLLKQGYEREIILQEKVDDRLLGGLILRVGDSRVDGSLRTRLSLLGSHLEAARLTSEDFYED